MCETRPQSGESGVRRRGRAASTAENRERVESLTEAQRAEIRDAIQALTKVQLLKLRNYAAWRIKGLGRKADGREAVDLLHEAMLATLAGRRKWNKRKVDLFGHLRGAIRGISWCWAKKKGVDLVFECELPPPGEARRPAEIPVVIDLERHVSHKQQLTGFRELFADDADVLRILDYLESGWSMRDIQAVLSKRVYAAAMKRIRRRLARPATKIQRQRSPGPARLAPAV